MKEAVNCRFSNFSHSLQPSIADSVRLQSQSVSATAPTRRPRAASMASSVTGRGLAKVHLPGGLWADSEQIGADARMARLPRVEAVPHGQGRL